MHLSPPSVQNQAEDCQILCPRCCLQACRNGKRHFIAQVQMGEDGAIIRIIDMVRLRGKCMNRNCLMRSFTIYEVGGYPHLRYALSVVLAILVAGAMMPGATLTSLAKLATCDRRSVARWMVWAVGLCDVDALAQLCVKHDPSGMPPPSLPALVPAALPAAPGTHTPAQDRPESRFRTVGRIVLLLEHWACLLRTWGVALESGPGLVAVLRWQFLQLNRIFCITKSSPGKVTAQAFTSG